MQSQLTTGPWDFDESAPAVLLKEVDQWLLAMGINPDPKARQGRDYSLERDRAGCRVVLHMRTPTIAVRTLQTYRTWLAQLSEPERRDLTGFTVRPRLTALHKVRQRPTFLAREVLTECLLPYTQGEPPKFSSLLGRTAEDWQTICQPRMLLASGDESPQKILVLFRHSQEELQVVFASEPLMIYTTTAADAKQLTVTLLSAYEKVWDKSMGQYPASLVLAHTSSIDWPVDVRARPQASSPPAPTASSSAPAASPSGAPTAPTGRSSALSSSLPTQANPPLPTPPPPPLGTHTSTALGPTTPQETQRLGPAGATPLMPARSAVPQETQRMWPSGVAPSMAPGSLPPDAPQRMWPTDVASLTSGGATIPQENQRTWPLSSRMLSPMSSTRRSTAVGRGKGVGANAGFSKGVGRRGRGGGHTPYANLNPAGPPWRAS